MLLQIQLLESIRKILHRGKAVWPNVNPLPPISANLRFFSFPFISASATIGLTPDLRGLRTAAEGVVLREGKGE
jgi:hypothetical protein